MEKIGIYQILNIKDGKCYIGKSKDLLSRQNQHFIKLEKGKHENKKLCNIPIEYLVFNILIECDFKYLDYYEWFYIKKYNSIKNGYNISKPINFEKVDLDRYKNIIEEVKLILNNEKDKRLIITKDFLKNKFNIFNFSAFCYLISKYDFDYHVYLYFIDNELFFETKEHRFELFNKLNY
jgi:hypothetical protein